MADDIVELDLGVRPEAAVSGAVCLQTEARTFLTFNAMRRTAQVNSHDGSTTPSSASQMISRSKSSPSRTMSSLSASGGVRWGREPDNRRTKRTAGTHAWPDRALAVGCRRHRMSSP